MDEIKKLQYEDELKANRFSCKFLAIVFVCCLLVLIANELGIFVVNKIFMRLGIAISCICLIIPISAFKITKGRKYSYKYLVIICLSLAAITIQTFLTFHGVMMCMFPVLLAVQYSDKMIIRIAFVMNMVGIFIATVLGYFYGCWDGNMSYAVEYGVTVEVDSLARRVAVMDLQHMNALVIYFVIPRILMYSVISLSISYILKTRQNQYIRENIIRLRADTDGLTGLENRAKYEQRLKNEYMNLESVFIAFVDVNFLKKINDLCGHEAGDAVLKRVANEMKRIIDESIHAYRLGGDEFAFVFCNYSKENANKIMDEWYRDIGPLNRKEDVVKCSLAIGVSYGEKNFDVEMVLAEADKNMYERKKAMKAERVN